MKISWLRRHGPTFLTVAGFTVFYVTLFWQLRNGVGNNWDWVFPYFSGFNDKFTQSGFSAWQTDGLGGQTGYASWAIANLFHGLFLATGINPEIYLFIFIIGLFAIGSTLVYSFFKEKSPVVGLLIALAVFVNPVIFYKLLAGHLTYLIGFVFLIATVLNIFRNGIKSFKSAVILGLLLAFAGVQIQLLLFGLIFVLTWAFFWRENVNWKYLSLSYIVVALIHFFWIGNFLNGTNSVIDTAASARISTFPQLEQTSLINVWRLVFSEATFISRFFTTQFQVIALLVSSTAFYLLFLDNKFKKTERFWLVILLVFSYLSTGIYRNWPIPILSELYPLLREAGHSAPLVVLALMMIIGTKLLNLNSRARALFLGIISLFILFSAYNFFNHLPKINYSQVRAEFAEFETLRKHDLSEYRVLTYPFFNQNRFIDQPQVSRKNTPMSNSGWDSYTILSGFEYLDNSESAKGVQESLLNSYDLKTLEPYNVKYIFNYFDGIYRSEAQSFLNESTYSSALQTKNNDLMFIEKLIENNPGRLKKISPRVWEIVDYQPRISLVDGKTEYSRVSASEYSAKINIDSPNEVLRLSNKFHEKWQLSIVPRSGNKSKLIARNSSEDNVNNWSLDREAIKSLGSDYYNLLNDQSLEVNLVASFQPESHQKRFNVISLITIIGALLYLVREKRKNV